MFCHFFMKGNVETYRRQEHGEMIPQLFEVAEKLGGVVSGANWRLNGIQNGHGSLQKWY